MFFFFLILWNANIFWGRLIFTFILPFLYLFCVPCVDKAYFVQSFCHYFILLKIKQETTLLFKRDFHGCGHVLGGFSLGPRSYGDSSTYKKRSGLGVWHRQRVHLPCMPCVDPQSHKHTINRAKHKVWKTRLTPFLGMLYGNTSEVLKYVPRWQLHITMPSLSLKKDLPWS